jgi:PhzF family phenazine biosynthesis protein
LGEYKLINIPVFQVDAFTDQPFIGNPAAVCLLMEEKSDEWMLNVAREMNCSETAFLLNKEEGISLRWFSPKAEVGLCGHATLASAHVLWEKGIIPRNVEILFFTKGGLLTAQYKEGWIELNFPAIEEKKVFPSEILLDALKVPVLYVGKSKYDYLVEIETEEILKDMNPDFETLKIAVPRGVIVTCQSDRPEFDFISRFFVPSLGINEDPVTGSAHCVLGPYWQKKLNKSELIAYQASERGGVIKVKIEDDRVYISGKAVTITDGVLLV